MINQFPEQIEKMVDETPTPDQYQNLNLRRQSNRDDGDDTQLLFVPSKGNR